MSEYLGFVPWWVWVAVIGLPLTYFIARNWIVKVPSGKLAILENVFKGRSIETGRILARPNEMGVRRDYWKQGWHIVKYPLTKVKGYEPLTTINELAIIEALDGAPLPPDRKFADDPAGSTTDQAKDFHERFQNPEGFYDHGGIRGIQLRLATQGPWMFHPYLFKHTPIARTVIRPGFVGVVTAHDGRPLEPGQILGKRVAGHDHFQNAAAFIENGGQAGPQIEQLAPGTYNIHGSKDANAQGVMFTIEEKEALIVPQGKMAILNAKIGKQLPKGEVCAVTPEGDELYTDAQKFIDAGGVQGPQTRMIGAGTTYWNPMAFDKELVDLREVKPGWVAARITLTGKEPELPAKIAETDKTATDASATDPAAVRFNSGVRETVLVESGFRGLQKEVRSPGKYAFNKYAEQYFDWPISVRTVMWAKADQKDETTSYFDQFLIQSNDGQDMKVEVRMTYRVLPEWVPAVLRDFGSPEALEQQVIHPQVENIFRNQVTKSPAIAYVQNRDSEVDAAFQEAKEKLAEYHVEVTALLITNLIPPPKLTEILSSKSLAEQEKSKWAAMEQAEKSRIEYVNRSAEADQQTALRQAQTNIMVAQNEADATKKRAEGEASRIKAIGEANAAATTAVGTAEAAVIQKKGEATGEAYRRQAEALGPNGLVAVELFNRISEGKVKITPDIVVGATGEGNGGNGMQGMLSLLLAQSIAEKHVVPAAAPAVAAEPTGQAAAESDANHAAPTAGKPTA